MKRRTLILSVFLAVVSIGTQVKVNAAPTVPEEKQADFKVRIEQVVSEDYPNLKVFLSVGDKNGDPVSALVRGNFSALIDTTEQKDKFEISAFQYTEAPISYVVLVTVNGLWAGELLQQQKNALMNLVDQLRDRDTLSLYTIGEPPKALFENLTKDKINMESITKLDVDKENKALLFDSVTSISQKLKATPNERKVMVVISDGRDQQGRYNIDQMLRAGQLANVPMYTIGVRLIGGAGLSNLDALSQTTGARYTLANNYGDIPVNMNSLVKKVLQSYVVVFRANGLDADDDFHQLTIKVTDQGAYAKDARSFLAKKIPVPLWLKIVLLVLLLLIIVVLVVLFILNRIAYRKKLGINKRRCPDCHSRMKDDWDFCPFCRYASLKKPKKAAKDKK